MPVVDPEVIIVGSGVAGTALATVLARDGRNVVLLEKDSKQRVTLCGEFIQVGGVIALQSLGLQECLEAAGAAVCRTIKTITPEMKVLINMDVTTSDHNIAARTVDYGRFVLVLRKVAIHESRVHYVEGTVTDLIENNGCITGVNYQPKGTLQYVELRAPLTIVADGPNSRFRKQLGLPFAQPSGMTLGFAMPTPPEIREDEGFLMYGEDTYAVAYPFLQQKMRVIIFGPEYHVTPPTTMKDFCKQYGLRLLPDVLREPYQAGMEAGTHIRVPLHTSSSGPVRYQGVILMADALSARHPITAGGVSCALQDVILLRRLMGELDSLHDKKRLQNACRTFVRQRTLQYALGINVLAGLFELFTFSRDVDIQRLKIGTLDYIAAEGFRKDKSDNILNCMKSSWHYVIGHLFLAVFYGAYAGFKPRGILGLPRAIPDTCLMLYKGVAFLASRVVTELRCIW